MPALQNNERSRALEYWLRELAKYPPMRPDEAFALARELVAHREALWQALLSYTPLSAAVLAEVERYADDGNIGSAARDIRLHGKRTAALRAALKLGHKTKAKRVAVARAVLEVAPIAAWTDADMVVTNRLVDVLGEAQVGLPPKERTSPLERALWRCYQSTAFSECMTAVRGHSIALRRCRQRLVERNLRLVVACVRRWGFTSAHVPVADLVAEGNIGLMKAVMRFDPERAVRFSTYACWWIRQSLTRLVQNTSETIRVPVHMRDLLSRVGRARRALEPGLGRDATDLEVAEKAGVTEREVRRARRAFGKVVLSIDQEIEGHDNQANRTLGEILADESLPDLVELLADSQLAQVFDEVLAEQCAEDDDRLSRPYYTNEDESGRRWLTRGERTEVIVRGRLGLDRPVQTLREIGDEIGVTRERVRQEEMRIHKRLRARMRRRLADDGVTRSSE